MSKSLQPHELQNARLPCLSLLPRVCSNSCPLSQWCHPTILFSVTAFSSCPQSFPASGSLPVSRLLTSNGQSIGASASISVLPMNIQGWFLLEFTGLISLQSKGLSRVFCRIQDARGWCTGMTQRDGTGREEGRGFRMGNTCTPVVDSCWCMAKPTQYCKVISLQLKEINLY